MMRILLCTLSLVACAATAAEPWAMWTHFTGGAADTVLASTADGTLQAVEDPHGVAGERTFTCDLETRTLQLLRVRVQTP